MAQYVTKKIPRGGGMCMGEDEARYFLTQILNAIEYCHQHQVAHRDLKLDNILLDEHNPPWIKLCDFGFSKPWNMDQRRNLQLISMRVGTPDYMGPEVIRSECGKKGYDGAVADVWSTGVLLFVMLMAEFPFDSQHLEGQSAEDEEQLTYNVWEKQHKGCWRTQKANARAVTCFSSDLKDLLDKVFVLDPDKRITLQGVRAHAWMAQPLPDNFSKALSELNALQQSFTVQLLKEGGQVDAVYEDKLYDPKMFEALKVMRVRAVVRGSPGEELMRLKFKVNATQQIGIA